MSPDQERLLREYLEATARERAAGHTIEAVHLAVTRLFDEVHDIRHRVGVLERWRKDVRRWWDGRGPHDRPRDPMPTLNPDDSGQIELHALGSGVTFRGPLPVKFAGAILVIAALLASGWGLHAAIAHDAIAIHPPPAIPAPNALPTPGVHP
jgi:hypothetical protein